MFKTFWTAVHKEGKSKISSLYSSGMMWGEAQERRYVCICICIYIYIYYIFIYMNIYLHIHINIYEIMTES